MCGGHVNTDDASVTVVSVGIVSRYLALEGVDGSGKSTVAAALARLLEARGEEVMVVREPGGTDVGEAVRGLLLDSSELDVWAEAFLFAAQRAELTATVVAPALEAGVWVISDRSYYSSIAYQGHARGLGTAQVRMINETGLRGVVPDLVFILDTDPEESLARQHRVDRIGGEGLDFQARVREGYLALADEEPDRVKVLEGSLPVDSLVEAIMGWL
jgi:dTMP kinase